MCSSCFVFQIFLIHHVEKKNTKLNTFFCLMSILISFLFFLVSIDLVYIDIFARLEERKCNCFLCLIFP